jgi:hypothetical protein
MAARSGWRRRGWQAALTKPGRASTARWSGPGERCGKEYARNRRLRLAAPAGSCRITELAPVPTRGRARCDR